MISNPSNPPSITSETKRAATSDSRRSVERGIGMRKSRWATRYGLPFLACLGVWMTFPPVVGSAAINPALAAMTEAFPEASYSTVVMLSTLPTLIAIASSLLLGPLAGRKIGFRPMAIAGYVLIVVAGMLPVALPDLTTILVSRCALGIGIGALSPMGSAITLRSFGEGAARTNMLSIGNAVLSIFGIVMTLGAGVLANIYWRYTFLVYAAFALPLLVIVLFMREPAPDASEGPQAAEGGSSAKRGLPGDVILNCLVLTGVALVASVPALNCSSVITENGLGNAAIAGVIVIFHTIGGLIGNVLYPLVLKAAKRFAIPASLMLGATAAVVFTVFEDSLAGLAVGLLLNGIAFNIIVPGLQNEAGRSCPPAQMSLASSLLMAGMSGGTFLSGMYISLWMDVLRIQSYTLPVLGAGAIWTLMAVGLALYQLSRENPQIGWSDD